MNQTENSADPFSLSGKRILVTGASSGIGRQIAISCAEAGAQVILTGRSLERLESTCSVLEGTGHIYISANLSEASDIDNLITQLPILDGLAHAAGISRLVPFRMMGKNHLDEMFLNNTYAPILLTKGLLAKKKLSPKSSLLWIASVASHVGPVASAGYAASKSALLGAMRTLGREVAKQSIRINCIAPGYVRTPLLDGLQGGGANMTELFDLAPLGLGEVEDIASASIFFLSDASRWITRNYYVIDGGLTIPMDIYA